ncbi:MAG: molybdopterin oxidoreductase [Armatimonadota bacterium]|nr:MAG: molybdopterin oxidoreductase [Armatimonadota bacterium]
MNNKHSQPLNLEEIRQRLAQAKGQQYWRSLEEIAESEEFRQILEKEFPRQSSPLGAFLHRRQFLKLMGASLALAGLTSCRPLSMRKIVPQVQQPEEMVPGKPLYFASAFSMGGYARGVLVESHEGRPTKIEGNAKHPASPGPGGVVSLQSPAQLNPDGTPKHIGASDAFTQASILTLYDPDRSQSPLYQGQLSAWTDFNTALAAEMAKQAAVRGAGLRILTDNVTSPTLAALIQELLKKYPQAKWHQYEPLHHDNALEGAKIAFGAPVNTVYRFERAEVILSLDSDFLFGGPAGVRYAHDYATRRQVRHNTTQMNRLYVVESTPTVTGAAADHRLPLRPSQIRTFALALAKAVGLPVSAPQLPAEQQRWVEAVARDLQAHRSRCAVIVGESQPPEIHALVHAINHTLGNAGQTVFYTQPVEASPVNHTESLRELVQDMAAGKVETLVILGGNPAYNAPADMEFASLLREMTQRNGFTVHLSLYEDETSALCLWHIPESHYLETWGDVRAFDGTVSIIQPLIEPLYPSRSAWEMVDAMLGRQRNSYDIVQAYWSKRLGSANFQKAWRKALHDGVIAGTALPPSAVQVRVDAVVAAVQKASIPAGEGLEIVFTPDPTVWDGRFANNGWLQELPKPLSHLTWDNAAFVSPATAQKLGLQMDTGGLANIVDVVELRYRGEKLHVPVWILPGQPDDCVTLSLGYGRTRAGKVGTGIGYNAYKVRFSDALWTASGATLVKTGERYPLASTQQHHSMHGRDLVQVGTLDEFRSDPKHLVKAAAHEEPLPSMYPEHKWEGYAWAMVIDTSLCIGCNACVTACQAENNIPVVGKEQVARGREMHWIRIDRYYEGGLDNPSTHLLPVPCMQCENAPCEPVCPVGATNHSEEGLNQMVYNRCVGTRYCSNNCPYKVRRFNFLKYNDPKEPVLQLLNNPDVTVRGRGVMEKCTYCVQRINAARIEAKKLGREIQDGEVVTACQAACPTHAIVFGNMNDRQSLVARLRQQPHRYGLLEELNTRPRTTYLAKVRNPNPELEGV